MMMNFSPAGLLITYVALNLMDGHGQPALLYIVPFTLGNEIRLMDNLSIVALQLYLASINDFPVFTVWRVSLSFGFIEQS